MKVSNSIHDELACGRTRFIDWYYDNIFRSVICIVYILFWSKCTFNTLLGIFSNYFFTYISWVLITDSMNSFQSSRVRKCDEINNMTQNRNP